MSSTKNCHYVTRGMTTPWEVDDRRLWFYDFEKDKILKLSSRSLFAENELLSPEAEKKFNQLIETPLLELRSIVEKDPQAANFEWKLHRATFLYFLGQVQRFGTFLGDKSKKYSLEEFLNKDEQFHDQLTLACQQKYQIIGINIPASQQLFFPQTGFFPFFFLDDTQVYKFTSGFAVPLTPNSCIGMVKKTADTSQFQNQLQIVSPASLGLKCNQVIVPPEIKLQNSDETIIEHIKEKREQTRQYIRDCFEGRSLIQKVFAIAGLSLDKDDLSSFLD